MLRRISNLKFQISNLKSLCVLCVLCASVVCLLFVIARASAFTRRAPQSKVDTSAAYKLPDGPYKVASVVDLSLRDDARGKDLPVAVRYPQAQKAGEKFPVVVFSHGLGASGKDYAPLTEFWASHGYVVLQPTHADSYMLRRERGMGALEAARDLADELGSFDGREDRARDVTFLLDSLGEIENRVPALKGRLDRTRVGVGGHSYGAYTSQMIGGATLKLAGDAKPRSFADKRVAAVLLLSAPGHDDIGLSEGSWDSLRVPMMLMTGSKDTGRAGQSPEWRLEPYKFSPAGDKYAVFIEGANHLSFTGRWAGGGQGGAGAGGLLARRFDRLAEGTDQRAIFDDVKQASLAFWDAYLKGDARAKEYLKSDALTRASGGAARLSRK
jgi:predicted dienelactone hydrolase